VIINKVKDISPFIREIIYKAQLFINYYVLHKCIDDIPNLIFTQNFWYSVCKVIFGSISQEVLQQHYPTVSDLRDTFSQYLNQHPTCLKLLGQTTNYSDTLSERCKIAAITYNNYYVETYTQKIINYCRFKLKEHSPHLSNSTIATISQD
jgi:hypothetical protein